MLNTSSTPIILFNVCVVKRFGRDQHKDRLHRTAEFHLLCCKFSGLCNACDCSGTTLCTCGELWHEFLQDPDRLVPSKAQTPTALDAWRVWGQHAGLSVQQQELCLGPELSVRVFERATVGNTRLACTRVEKPKFACDSVALTKSNGKYWAGWVNAFLSHAPPGWEDCHLSEEANVAEVDWFADAVPAAGISSGLSVCLGCSVFKMTFKMTVLAISGSTPCKLASLPHSSHSDNLVVLSCFASVMHQVPEVS